MRFVPLKIDKGNTPCESILQFGCGPNYVLNRLKLFVSMIKEQGEIFWFRFWLNFCFFPGCFDLTAVQNQWPIITSAVYINMHKQFLEGSVDESIQYCLDAIHFLRQEFVSPNRTRKRSPKKQHSIQHEKNKFQILFEKSSKIAFGAALCVVFHAWLNAGSMKNNIDYWTLPKEYLQPNYRPGFIETYLIDKWKTKLYLFLNVEENSLPWIKDRLDKKPQCPNDNAEVEQDNELNQSAPQISEFMSMRGEQRRKAVKYADEKSNTLSLNDNKMSRNYKKKSNVKKPLKSGENYVRNFCLSSGVRPINPIIRKNWQQPTVFCSPSSISNHWFTQNFNQKIEQDIDSNSTIIPRLW